MESKHIVFFDFLKIYIKKANGSRFFLNSNEFWWSKWVSSTPFWFSGVWGNRTLKTCCLEQWVSSICEECDDENLGASFEWRGRTWVKMLRYNIFSRNVNTINLKKIPTHGGICKCEGKCNRHSEGRNKALRSLKKYGRMYPWG